MEEEREMKEERDRDETGVREKGKRRVRER